METKMFDVLKTYYTKDGEDRITGLPVYRATFKSVSQIPAASAREALTIAKTLGIPAPVVSPV